MDVPVAIVGGGVMGMAAAWALGKRGVRCAVLDPLPRRTERNASNDESKVYRVAYEDRVHDTRLAHASLPLWRGLEEAARRPLLHQHGLLLLARGPGGYADASARVLDGLGLEAERIDGPALEERVPAFAGGGFSHAVLDPLGGLLDPPAVLEALETEAIAGGARFFRGRQVRSLAEEQGRVVCALEHGSVRAGTVIVAAGTRAPLLLPELEGVLRTTRQPEFAYAPAEARDFEAPRLPVFAAFEDGFYGFPLHRGAVKVADHRKGPEVPHEPPMDPPTPEEEGVARGWLARAMPALAGAPLARSRVCHYDNTADDDPLLGWHPSRKGVLLAAGFSGHGFKLAPAVGEALADLATGREPAQDLQAFAPGRLLPA